MKKATFCKLETSLGRNFVYNLQTFRILSSAFLRFCCKFSMKIIFYLTVNNGKPKVFGVLVFVCTTASISSIENISKRDAILVPVSNQRIAKDIPSYKSQSKRAKLVSLIW